MSAVFGWVPPRPKHAARAAQAASAAAAHTPIRRGRIRPMLYRTVGSAPVKSGPCEHLPGQRDQLIARQPWAQHPGGPPHGPEEGGHADEHVPSAGEQVVGVLT